MTKCVLHSFLIPSSSDETIHILPLRAQYRLTPSAQHDGSTLILIEEIDGREEGVDDALSLAIDSMTIIYGINGGGKTQLLLDICNTLAQQDRRRPIGVLWEEHGQLHFDGGLRVQFRGAPTVRTTPLRASTAAFGTVFYTTSPFEGARRRRCFSNGDTVDATPSFNVDNSFGGVSLLRASGALPRELPFIEQAEIEASIAIPRLRFLIDHYTGYRSRGGGPSEPRYAGLDARGLDLMQSLPKRLSRRLSTCLAIEMEGARVEGDQAAMQLLSQVIAAPDLSNIEPYVLELLRWRASQRNTPNAFDIVDALGVIQGSGRASSKVMRTFLAYVDGAQAWSEPTFKALQRAEALGILEWSFQKLSSGQVAMLMLFASLANALESLAQNGMRCLMLTVDEGEMFMHPAWQRSYLSHLLTFLRFYRTRFDAIHLVLSTHSLIVAGDAPPNRLYDVVSGKMENGFAARPEELLDTVYHVKNFSGEYVDRLYSQIGQYLREGGTPEDAFKVRTLVSQIASDRLRHYLEDEVDRRIGDPDAQAENTPRS